MRPPQLSDEEFRLFSEWLAEEYGLCFGPAKRDILRSRLEPRRAELGFDTFEQLYFHLKFHPQRAAERERLLPHLTNNESYFFRERGQLDVLRDEVIAEVQSRLRSTSRREIRILSAACASGEEPYTLAMLLHDMPTVSSPWRVRLTGVDLDPLALERARAGQYTSHAFRGLAAELRERWFRRVNENRWEILPALREAVEFRSANLVDPAWSRDLPPQDIIFCRNVLIYFDTDGLARAAQGLHNALAAGGYLFLGHAESLSRIPTPLRPERRPGAIFYRRSEADDKGTGSRADRR